MQRTLLMQLASALLFSFVGGELNAKQLSPTDCEASLIKDRVNFSRDYERELNILNSITDLNYSESKENFDWDAAAAIYGVPFSSSMKFSDFQSARSEIFKRFKFNESLRDSITYSSEALGANSLTAYQSCLEAVARSSYSQDFTAWIGSYTEKIVKVTILWNLPEAYEGDSNFKILYLDGGELVDSIPGELQRGTPVTMVFARNTDENGRGVEFHAILKGGVQPGMDIKVPGPAKFEVPCRDVHSNDQLTFQRFLRHERGDIYTPASCRVTVDYAVYDEVSLDLACIAFVQDSNQTALEADGYDCSSNNTPKKLIDIKYGAEGDRTTFTVKPSYTCERILNLMGQMGIKEPPAFCR